MRKMSHVSLLLILLLLTVPLFSQSFTQFSKEKYGQKMSFPQMQKAFAEWSQTVDLNKEKGWKAYKRWEDYQTRRANGDGSLFDPGAAEIEALKVAKQKQKIATNKTRSINNWIPMGPDVVPSPLGISMIPGIGRVNCIEFHPTDTNTYWIGVAQGGIWKTVDDGDNWTPLNNNLPIIRISDIEVDPVNPDTIYISVCDFEYMDWWLESADKNRQTHFGLGIYKTTNGGQSWSPTGLSTNIIDKDYSLTRRIYIHPTNRSTLIAAGSYGIKKSTDDGATWNTISTDLVTDLTFDPSNNNTLYAATGFLQFQQTGSFGILKSTDFGDNWNLLNTGLPTTDTVLRARIKVAPSDPNYVYAITVDEYRGLYGLYRSTDAGTTWQLRSNSPNVLNYDMVGGNLGGQGSYDLALLVHPHNRDIIYTGGVNIWASSDGGITMVPESHWTINNGSSLHADQHQFAYSPLSSKIFVCNDGGLYSTDSIHIGSYPNPWGTTWTDLNAGRQTTSFYRMSIAPRDPGYMMAGAQDNATFYYDKNLWNVITGGDGMGNAMNPNDGLDIWSSSQYGNFRYSDDGGLSNSWIPKPNSESGEWVTPIQLHPDSADLAYMGWGNLYKTFDYGNSFSQLSNFSVVPALGQPMHISHFAIAPSNPNKIYVAKRVHYGYNEPGAMWMTSNGGISWADITAGVPDSLYITYVEVDHADPNTCWITLGGHTAGVKVFKTTNSGSNWQNVSGTLPNISMNCIRHDASSKDNQIYVGTDVGVYYRNDLMSDWQLYSSDLPNVIIGELEVDTVAGELYACTFGRGIWKVDLKEDSIIAGMPNPDLNAEMTMKLFPNPNKGTFTLALEKINVAKARMKIVNVMGRLMLEKELSFEGTEFSLELTTKLPGGMYWLIVEDGARRRSGKFLVD